MGGAATLSCRSQMPVSSAAGVGGPDGPLALKARVKALRTPLF